MFQKIMIANDHGGLLAKQLVLDYLLEKGYEVENIGTDTAEIVRYPYYAAQVAQAVAEKRVDAGILICSTGIGMSIIANKFAGVRASVCTSHYTAMMTRRHNDSNILCLGGKILGDFEIIDILEAWLSNEFEGGRHCISLGMIEQFETHNLPDAQWLPPRELELTTEDLL